MGDWTLKWCFDFLRVIDSRDISTMWGPPVMWTLVNKSPSNYSYKYHKPVREIGVIWTNLAIDRGPHIVKYLHALLL